MLIFSDFRGFRGEFCRFNMIPGMYEYNIVPSDQFILSIHSDTGGCIYQSGKPVVCKLMLLVLSLNQLVSTQAVSLKLEPIFKVLSKFCGFLIRLMLFPTITEL